MKKIILQTVAILLILAGMTVSCGKDKDNITNISLYYVNCPCEQETEFIEKKTYENILMFDIAKTSFDEIRKITLDEQSFGMHVIIDFETKTAGLNIFRGTFYSGITICNFPVNRIPYTISENGMYISITGDIYETCVPKSFIPEHSYFNLVLTSLKIQQ
jgi:hypothetical protein